MVVTRNQAKKLATAQAESATCSGTPRQLPRLSDVPIDLDEYLRDNPLPASTPTSSYPSLRRDQAPMTSDATDRKVRDPYFREYQLLRHDFSDYSKPLLEMHWDDYIEAVVSLVVNHFPSTYPWDDLTEDCKADISSWALNPKETIEGTHYGCGGTFFAAWVNRFLYENLFSPDCQTKWKGAEWYRFAQLYSDLKKRTHFSVTDAPFLFYNGRSLSARVVIKARGPHVDVRELGSRFHAKFDYIMRNGPRERSAAIHAVAKVIIYAAHFDLYMIGVPFEIIMEFWDPKTRKACGFPYDYHSGSMEYKDLFIAGGKGESLDGMPVEYIRHPRIRSFGRTLRFHFRDNESEGFKGLSFRDPINYLGAMHEEPGRYEGGPLEVVLDITKDQRADQQSSLNPPGPEPSLDLSVN
ncbi:hypothetical protein B0I35DRAFT_480549 [Stachybotrys elegans]|uniref:Uncharacterized protein n=1 Tax=Stachybotrys elegans TaxID=80388 RepID=A0A8K0WQ13_9HYPO|nr:hypothetical protein B0I35DRAFT_480549 [Stachybotrys elegans]